VVFDLLEDHLNILGIALFELLLKVSTTMLILAQSVDLTLDVLERDVVEASGFLRNVSTLYHFIVDSTYLRRPGCASAE